MTSFFDLTCQPDFCYSAVFPFAALSGGGSVCAQNNSDPKKLGKEKKPDANLVSRVFPG